MRYQQFIIEPKNIEKQAEYTNIRLYINTLQQGLQNCTIFTGYCNILF